jgi:hypothetical protein
MHVRSEAGDGIGSPHSDRGTSEAICGQKLVSPRAASSPRHRAALDFDVMTLRARVRNGRLTLDEPTDLPDGAEVELVPMDDIDELNPEERARLHGFLAESIRKHVPGTGIPADRVISRVRGH